MMSSSLGREIATQKVHREGPQGRDRELEMARRAGPQDG